MVADVKGFQPALLWLFATCLAIPLSINFAHTLKLDPAPLESSQVEQAY